MNFPYQDKLVASGMGWAGDVPSGMIRAIGVLEILGGIGLVLPAAIDVAPGLVPWAAAGLAVTMLGAAAVHGRRREHPMIGMNLILLALSVVVAWGRFGPHAF
ncbi:DoxX family protein [Streptomyces sp. NPDC003832]